jgi:hypothetical protein
MRYYSTQHLRLWATHRCDACHKFFLQPKLFYADGAPASTQALQRWITGDMARTVARPLLGEPGAPDRRFADAYAACPRCGHRWPVFGGGTAPEPAAPAGPAPFELHETMRTEEPLGEERRQIDNSQSSVECERRFRVAKEWTRRVVVDREKASTRRGEAGLALDGLIKVGGALERELRDRYSVTDEARHLYEEEIALKVGARTRVVVLLAWKRIWQHGEAVALAPDGARVTVPYRVAVGVTFDQTQYDAP